MAFISLKCPSCGADIELDNSREFGFCSYCGTKLVREKKIVEHRGSVSIDRTNEIKNLLLRGREMYSAGRLDDAEIYYNRVLDMDALNKEARDSLANINKTIDNNNVIIEWMLSNVAVSPMAKMRLKLNGQKIGFVNVGQNIVLKLPIGVHYIEPYFMGGIKGKPVAISISNRKSRVHIAFVLRKNGVFASNSIEYILK